MTERAGLPPLSIKRIVPKNQERVKRSFFVTQDCICVHSCIQNCIHFYIHLLYKLLHNVVHIVYTCCIQESIHFVDTDKKRIDLDKIRIVQRDAHARVYHNQNISSDFKCKEVAMLHVTIQRLAEQCILAIYNYSLVYSYN